MKLKLGEKVIMLIKKITSAILAVAMVAAMSTTVFAKEGRKNNTDKYLTNFAVTAYQKFTGRGTKDDSSSIYAKITNTTGSTSYAVVNVWGGAVGGTTFTNCNYGVNDRLMPFYSPVMIRNNVIENGKRDTLLAFSHNGTTSNYIINGKWSPDSVPESGSVTI